MIVEDGSSAPSAPPSPPQPSAPPSSPQPSVSHLPPSQTAVHNPQPDQVELPFSGLTLPGGAAVDTAGNVYITEFIPTNRMLKLPAQ